MVPLVEVTWEADANKYSSRISNHMRSHSWFSPTCRRPEGQWAVLLVLAHQLPAVRHIEIVKMKVLMLRR